MTTRFTRFEDLSYSGEEDLWSTNFSYPTEVEEEVPSGDFGVFGSVNSDDGFFNPLEEEGFYATEDLPEYLHPGLTYGVISHSIGECLEDIKKVDKALVEKVEKPKKHPCILPSLELLQRYGRGIKRLGSTRRIEQTSDCVSPKNTRMSPEEIMRFAGQRFIQLPSQRVSNPYDLYSSGFSREEIEDLELVTYLLMSADKVDKKEFSCVSGFLNQCGLLSSKTGNPVQRVVHYFTQALQERFRWLSKGSPQKIVFNFADEMNDIAPYLACHQQVPFCQMEQFSGIQAIVENVSNAKRIHVVDLCIRNGMQWTILMQSLASRHECPIESLKITAIETSSLMTDRTGKWLTDFAKTLNLPFSFKAMVVPDLLELDEDDFEISDEETVAVYSFFFMGTLISEPDRLHSLMGVIKSINPCIMVMTEIEANMNQTNFMTRFTESLFYFGAYFDCLDSYMGNNVECRIALESMFGRAIKSIVAGEGEERVYRHVKIEIWRSFFSRFKMVEKDLSMSSLEQADLLAKKFDCVNSCTLDMSGKCLVIGWKGKPIHSLSVWKFLR